MTTEKTDVLVVGGGPAGATAAFQIATRGIAVTLIDRASFPREKVCGESLSPGALARLAAIGMWTPQTTDGSSHRQSMPIRGMRLRSPRGVSFVGRYKDAEASPGLAIRRTVFDAELLESARRRGVRVIEGVEAINVEETRDGAVVSARSTGTATRWRIEARRVIVADGRRSFLARQLGFIEPAETRHAGRRFAVRAHCAGLTGLVDLAEMHVGVGGYCGLAPLSATEANICYVLFRDRLDIGPRSLDADFTREIARYPEIARRLEGAHLQGRPRVIGPLRLRSRRQARGNFLACGDTTGFLDPFTGEGIAHAIASGVLGAEAVDSSLRGIPDAFRHYESRIRSLRRIKGMAALILYGLVSRPALANSTSVAFSRMPSVANSVVRMFGDAI